MWICPTCKSPDHLEVVVEQWAKLNQPDYDPGQFETDTDEASEHDHAWTENSVMRCTRAECADQFKCRIAGEFEVEACTLCNVAIEEGDGDNWDSFCPGCADKVSACMEAKGIEKEAAEDFIRENPDWEESETDGDLCDTCMASGVEIARTEGGKTICVDCDEDGLLPIPSKLQADREVGETEPRTEV